MYVYIYIHTYVVLCTNGCGSKILKVSPALSSCRDWCSSRVWPNAPCHLSTCQDPNHQNHSKSSFANELSQLGQAYAGSSGSKRSSSPGNSSERFDALRFSKRKKKDSRCDFNLPEINESKDSSWHKVILFPQWFRSATVQASWHTYLGEVNA